MRFTWIRARGVVVVSAAVMALQGVPALAQFVPYTPGPTQGYSQYQAHTAQQPQPYQAQQYQGQPQYAQPQYTAMAFQGSAARSVESVAPGQVMQSTPTQQNYSAAPAAGCNCQAAPAPTMSYSQPAPAATSFESYPSSYGSGSCGTYNTFTGGGCGVGAPYAGCDAGYGGGYLGHGLGARRGGRQWFGGFYGLYMERDGNPWKALAFSTADGTADGYYPADNEIVLNLTDIDNDTFAGAEVRFGSTIGGGCGCAPRLGWEVAYWGLLEETTTAVVTDTTTDGNRLYGMLPHTGMFYNGRSVNDYYDYGPPTVTPGGDEIQVRQLTARNSFSMQNLELNLLHFPLGGTGYYAAGGTGYGGGLGRGRGLGRRGARGACGAAGCDVGGCAGGCCDSGCGLGSCGGGCGGSRCSITGVVGVRYIRMDEDFMYRSDVENITTPGTAFISHDVDVDSHLVGAQFGMNALYRCGCSGRWALHCNSVVGVFGNHVEVWNRMDAPVSGGPVTNNDGTTFDYRYEDDDIALMGELRAGASYQYSCNWRLFGGYRLFGISGAALAFDQISNPNISEAQTQYVDSDGSIFIHGLQGGIECTY